MSGRTAVLGGGISGLSTAFYLLDNPAFRAIKVIEASSRTGGWLRSRVSSAGAIFEEGPRTIRPQGPAGSNTLDLVDRLKLTEKIIPIRFDHPAARNRLIYAKNKLHKLPNSLFGICKATPPLERSLISCLLNDLKAPRLVKDDESIYSFVERRLGKDIADYIVSPMICGICAGDAKQISVNFLMKNLFDYEKKYGSIVKGLVMSKWKAYQTPADKSDLRKLISSENIGSKQPEESDNKISSSQRAKRENWSIWTLDGGLEQLSNVLADNVKLRGVEISLNTKCEKLNFTEKGIELKLNNEIEEYSKVISSLPAKNLASLVRHQHPQLADELAAIPTVNVAVVNLEFVGNVLKQEAFGFLVPPRENLPILGVIFDSCLLPLKNSTVFTVMMGGAWFEANFGDNPTKEHLLSVAVDHVRSILNIELTPITHNVAILKDCIPQYVVGHVERVNRINNYIAENKLPLSLCGASYHGVGVNDVVLSAKEAIGVFHQ